MSEIRKPMPDAVATIYGWAHPRTGELLVSMKGLPNPFENYKLNVPFRQEKKETEVRVDPVEEIKVDEPTEEVQEESPSKPVRTRKKA
ncbi:MAG: hypothetical protein WC679_00020 [Bacteroidales bacterium]|jgi:hypothetical protein